MTWAMDTILCPTCDAPVIFTAFRNERSGRWVILPLDAESTSAGMFVVLEAQHSTVDLAGEDAGTYPVGQYRPGEGSHRPHSPSHWSLA